MPPWNTSHSSGIPSPWPAPCYSPFSRQEAAWLGRGVMGWSGGRGKPGEVSIPLSTRHALLESDKSLKCRPPFN